MNLFAQLSQSAASGPSEGSAAWIQAIASALALGVALLVLWYQTYRSDRGAKLQAAVALLQARATIQIESGKGYGEVFPRWQLISQRYLTPGNKMTANDLILPARAVASLGWGQFCYLRDGLFDANRFLMFSRFRVVELANLDLQNPREAEVASAIPRESFGFGDREFSEYTLKVQEAARICRLRKHRPGLLISLEDALACTEAEELLRTAIDEIGRHQDDQLYRDAHWLRRVADRLIVYMG